MRRDGEGRRKPGREKRGDRSRNRDWDKDRDKDKSKRSLKGRSREEGKGKRGEGRSLPTAAAFPPGAELRVSVTNYAQLLAALSVESIELIYLDEASFSDSELPGLLRRIREHGRRAGLRLRRIERTDRGRSSRELLESLLPEGLLQAVLYRSIEQLSLPFEESLKRDLNPLEQVFDYTVYAWNREAASVMRSLGAERLTYPIELKLPELLRWKEEMDGLSLQTELLAYGHLPMMVSANCIQKTACQCRRGAPLRFLKDRTGREMPVRMYCKYCYNEIYNPDSFWCGDLKEELSKLRADSLRFDFSAESAEDCEAILRGRPPLRYTRGRLRSGVE